MRPEAVGRAHRLVVAARVEQRDDVALVDRWSEDWAELGWVRLECHAELLEPEPREVEEHAAAVAALRAKYRQYAGQRLDDRPVLRFTVDRAVSWGNLDAD